MRIETSIEEKMHKREEAVLHNNDQQGGGVYRGPLPPWNGEGPQRPAVDTVNFCHKNPTFFFLSFFLIQVQNSCG